MGCGGGFVPAPGWSPGGAPSGPAGGDLGGTYPDPTVEGLDGRPIDITLTPGVNDTFLWDGAKWIYGSGGGGGTVTNTGTLTADVIVLGNGGVDIKSGTAGTATTVLHGNAAGAPTFGAVALTTDVSGILPSANGGTGMAFFTVAGPATTAKTFAFPNANAVVLTDAAAVTVPQGGTGVASFTAYAVICGGTTSTGVLQSVAALGAAGTALTSNGPAALPTFQTVAGGITGLANPSGTISLTAVNGSATTAIRSDGAPALSQAIIPTWTEQHTWNPGTLVDQENCIRFTATMPGGTLSAFNSAFNLQITPADSTQNQYGINCAILAGGTNSTSIIAAGRYANARLGTGTAAIGNSGGAGNLGMLAIANGTTAGSNVGLTGSGTGGDVSVGLQGLAIGSKTSAVYVGVLGLGLNSGTTPVNVGGHFALTSGIPTWASCAILADNGALAVPVQIWRDNGTEVARMDDGGKLGIGVTPTALLHLKAGTATAATAPLKFNSGTLNTTAEAGAVEFLTDKFYGTITTAAQRCEITLNDGALTATRVSFSTTNGRQTDSANLTFTGGTTLNAQMVAVSGAAGTAKLHIAAGSATATNGAFKMTDGSMLTAPEPGSIEYSNDAGGSSVWYGTDETPTRHQFSFADKSTTDATASRALDTTYTNSDLYRTMIVQVTVRCVTVLAAETAYVQAKAGPGATDPPTTIASGIVGIQAGLVGEDNTFFLSFFVPPNTKYRLFSTTSGTATVTKGTWLETLL